MKELKADGISLEDVVSGIASAVTVEDYPEASKGPSALVRQFDATGSAIHLVWGISKGQSAPAVLITRYRPDPKRWSDDFMRRERS